MINHPSPLDNLSFAFEYRTPHPDRMDLRSKKLSPSQQELSNRRNYLEGCTLSNSTSRGNFCKGISWSKTGSAERMKPFNLQTCMSKNCTLPKSPNIQEAQSSFFRSDSLKMTKGLLHNSSDRLVIDHPNLSHLHNNPPHSHTGL